MYDNNEVSILPTTEATTPSQPEAPPIKLHIGNASNRVVISFDRPTDEVVLTPRDARALAEFIRLQSYKAGGGTKKDRRKLAAAGVKTTGRERTPV